MKKTGSVSKDRLAKSGSTKKRTPSGSAQPPNSGLAHVGTGGLAGAANAGTDDSQDAPIVIWPEWSDAEIAAEKWTVKHVFEDPEGLGWLPRSVRGAVDSYRRPVDLAPENQSPMCIQPLHLLDDIFHSTAPSSAGSFGFNLSGTAPSLARSFSKASTAEGAGLTAPAFPEAVPETSENVNPTENVQRGSSAVAEEPARQASGTPATPGNTIASEALNETSHAEEEATNGVAKSTEDDASEQELLAGTSKLFQANRHLLGSDLMRTILCVLHFLYDQTKQARSPGNASGNNIPDEFCPWDQIYPKSKDGLPTYNISGKYGVKLFWLGAWRKVTVDDRIPVDAEGRPLLISSPMSHEIWPLLLTKALLKIVSLSYKETDGACEYGDFDVFHTLKGWLPEKLPVPDKPSSSLWNLLSTQNLKSYPLPVNPQPAAPLASRGSGANQGSPVVPVKDRTSIATAPQPDRSTMASASGARTGPFPASSGTPGAASPGRPSPYTVVFAWRDGEDSADKLDLNTMPFAFRVIDLRETVTITTPGAQANHMNSEHIDAPQRFIRLRSYYSCGTRTRRPGDAKGSKIFEEPAENSSEATDCWVPYSEFYRSFRSITIFHGQGSFKFVKTINNIQDPAKVSDIIRIPQLLYLTDVNAELPVILYLSTYGRFKNDATPQISSVLVEEYDWKGNAERQCVLRTSTNAAQSSYLRLPPGPQAYSFLIHCTTSYSLSIWAREDFALEDEGKYCAERLNLIVRDIDDTFPAQTANSWFLLVKTVLHFSQPTFLAANIYVPENLQQTTCLRIFDNDTNEEVPLVFYMLRPRTYLPNKEGYTLVADSRTTQARPAGKWKLRLVSESVPVLPPEKPLDMWTKPIVQDFEDMYTPNKHNILFRYVVKVKDAPINCVSLQLTFSVPSVWLKLQVFDNNVEIRSVTGKGVATIHVLSLLQTEDPVVAPAPTKADRNSEKSDKKSKDAGKEGNKEVAKDNAATPPLTDLPTLPKHKYIIQGSVERLELAKLAGLLPSTPLPPGEPSRPQSRGAKAIAPSASAKKKRTTTGPAGSSPASTQNQVSSKEPPTIIATEDKPAATGNEPAWHLRIISTDTASLAVARDTEKEDRHRAIKDSWEAAQPGRAARARESREAYLRQVESGTIRPIVITGIGGKNVPYKPWTIHGTMAAARLAYKQESVRDSHTSIIHEDKEIDAVPGPERNEGPESASISKPPSRIGSAASTAPVAKPHVLTREEIEARKAQRDALHREYEASQEAIRKARAEDREWRAQIRQLYGEKIEQKLKEVEEFREIDLERRETYRQQVIREIEEAQAKMRAALEAAARESAIAAEMSAEVDVAPAVTADKDKQKKKGTAKR